MVNGLKRKRTGHKNDDDATISGSKQSKGNAARVLPILDDTDGEVALAVNEEYARRFEHNKKREELHRLQEKYKTSTIHVDTTSLHSSSDDSSDSEIEDDDGVLASTVVDAQIQETLNLIRSKDPRVYDSSTVFFSPEAELDTNDVEGQEKSARPMTLSEYHKRNLLQADEIQSGVEALDSRTFADEQKDLRKSVISDIRDAASLAGGHEVEETDDTLLVAKERSAQTPSYQQNASEVLAEVDIRTADKDPEDYLNKYMSARAWLPTMTARFDAFDSDDEEHDQAAENFEEAYNLRFEDPSKANEKLTSHARDIVAKHSVRRTSRNARQRAREADQKGEMTSRQLRKEERARLRKLRVDAVQQKLQQIKDAAGISEEQMQEADWVAFLNDGWDDAQWETEMQKRFGSSYYQGIEETTSSLGQDKKNLKKPKWKEDIDISDLMSTTHTDLTADPVNGSSDAEIPTKGSHQAKDVRLERRKIERFVDEQMDVEEAKVKMGKKHQGAFKYRETSPVTFGLTAHDILMASDSQLNQHAGLKKYAAFRDSEKRHKDRKMLSKSARLRKWRKEAFGDEAGPRQTITDLVEEPSREVPADEIGPKPVGSPATNGERGSRKRRKKKSKL